MAEHAQRMLVGVDLGGGVDTFTEAKMVLPGSLLEAQNVRYNRDGVIQRSAGRAALGAMTSPSSVDKLLVRGEQLAAYSSDGTLSRYDAENNRWIGKKSGYLPVPWATARSIGPTSNTIGSGPFFGYASDVASSVVAGRTELAIAYCSDAGACVVDIVDAFTGHVKQSFTISGTFHDCRIAYSVWHSEFLVVVSEADPWSATAGAIKAYTVKPNTTSATLVWTSPTNALGNGVGFDMCFHPNDGAGGYGTFAVLYCAAGNTLTLGMIDGDTYANITAVTTGLAGVPKGLALATPPPTAARGFKCIASGAAFGTKCFFSNGSTITTALFTVSAHTDVVTACQDDAGNCYVSQTTSGASNKTSRYKITSGASVSSLDDFLVGVPASKIQLNKVDQGLAYQWMKYRDSNGTQNCYFLARLSLSAGNNDHQPIARVLYGKAISWDAIVYGVPSIVDFSNFTGTKKSMMTVLQGAPLTGLLVSEILKTSLHLTTFGLDGATGWQSAEAGNTAFVTGGFLAKFDGTSVTENGFLLAPDKPTLSAAAGTGVLAAGTYLVAVVFEEIDAAGRVHRSATSGIASITLAGGAGSSKITVQVPSYGAAHPDKNMRIAYYRSQKDKSILYREGVGAMTPTGGTITVTLTMADSSLGAMEQIYTQGGQWDNYQPSAPIALAFDKNRATAIEGDNLGRAIFSKRMIPGNALAFFPTYYRSAEVGGDELTAVASALSRKFAFKKRGIFVATGDGADDTLAADTLSQFEDQSKDIGAIDPRSVVVTQEGILFRSLKGIYLLGLDGSINYVGADVFAYSDVDDFKYQFAAFNRDTNEIHFVSQTATPAVLVLKLFRNKRGLQFKWTTGTLNGQANVKDVAVWGGYAGSSEQRLVYALNATSGGSVVGMDTPGVYSDALISPSAHVQQLITTNWIKLNGITGYGRLWAIYVLGNSYSSHQFKCDIAYDYESTWAETKAMSSVNATIGNSPYLFAMEPARTQCTAFRLRIYDAAYTNAAKDTFDLAGLMLDVGVYSGQARLRAEKSV